ncbi:MAG: LysE family translocator [Defluviicoccus sp.]|uniref:LysE family translocator n=1 Tax=Accumulibacter sp. TaxID=2053492 RepID=UPI00287907FC|nr:LysE family translocator [Accumulibacter sp.]MDG4575990.1 LysE family translocator [Defluviicoccus sp.]MDG4593298.1 LysE family translocator [Defluviicoccus sp.]MDS4015648.1 LysE family translocator [Accumulibacter sp.]
MTAETWLLFVAASALVLAIPGPTVLLVVSHALAGGAASGWRTVPGVALGDAVAITVSILGLGALLATSAALFTLLKWLGALYLVVLGIRLWRSSATDAREAPVARDRADRSATWQAFTVTVLNPKSIAFFIAFLPQFVAADAPAWPQLVILALTFVTLATLNATLYALVAGTFRARLRRLTTRRAGNRIGGAVLIGAGIVSAATQR